MPSGPVKRHSIGGLLQRTMSLVFVRSFLSIALLSSYGSTAPLDYKDPQTWFQADDLTSSPNLPDSSSSDALHVVVSPSVIPTYDSTTSPSPPPPPPPVSTITAITYPTIKTTVVPLTKIPTAASPVLTSTSTLRTKVNVSEPIVITATRSTFTSTLSPQARSTIVSFPNSVVATSTSIASPQNKSPVISSANSVIVHCSPNAGTASVSAVTGNERTSAVVQPEGTFTTAIPPLSLRRTTTQSPTIVVKNRGSNRKRTNNQSINGRNREACDMCTSYCSENRQICARPEGVNDDPDQLRGFPSVCHMDCFNVCRKIRYEKVADGRCGRLRDGIRPIGSKKKLTKIELNKTQYQITDGDDTIFVISPSY